MQTIHLFLTGLLCVMPIVAMEEAQRVTQLSGNPSSGIVSHVSATDAAFLSGQKKVVTGVFNRLLQIWDAQKEDSCTQQINCQCAVEKISYNKHGHAVASGAYGTVTIWDPETARLKQTLICNENDPIPTVCYDKMGALLTSLNLLSSQANLWDCKSGKLICSFNYSSDDPEAPSVCQFAHDGKGLILGGRNTSYIDLKMLKSAYAIKDTNAASIAVTNAGSQFAVGSYDRVKIYETQTGNLLYALNAHGKLVQSLIEQEQDDTTQKETPTSLSYNNDDTQLAVGLNDGTIVLCDVKVTPRPAKIFGNQKKAQFITALEFSESGNELLTAAMASIKTKTPLVKIWDIAQ